MKRSLRIVAVQIAAAAFALLAASCGDDASAPDATVRDASAPDATVRDASAPDATVRDATVPESMDGATPDASTPPSDAGPTDAATDSSTEGEDAGTDAGTDAGSCSGIMCGSVCCADSAGTGLPLCCPTVGACGVMTAGGCICTDGC